MADFEITVPVTDISHKLTLRQHIGEGAWGDIPIKLSGALPSLSPVVEIGIKGKYLVSIHDIAKAICQEVLGE